MSEKTAAASAAKAPAAKFGARVSTLPLSSLPF